jgi:uncharacterized membrane protein
MSAAFVAAHASGASLALVLGGWQLCRKPKGDWTHRMVGRVWVVAMYWTIFSSFFIQELNPGHYSWIHLLSVWTFISLTVGLWAALTGRIEHHQGWMTGSYFGLVGAFLGAVAVPDRAVPQLVVHRPVVFVLAVVGVVVAAATVIAMCAQAARRRQRQAPSGGTALSASRATLARPASQASTAQSGPATSTASPSPTVHSAPT